MRDFGLTENEAETITSNIIVIEFFEECLKLKNEPKVLCNWILTDIMKKLKESLDDEPKVQITAKNLVDLINMFQNKEISINNAREVLDIVWESGESVVEVAEKNGMKQDNNEDSVKQIVLQVIEENPQAVADFKGGNERAKTFFMGQVMKLSRGKANPQIVGKILDEELNKK